MEGALCKGAQHASRRRDGCRHRVVAPERGVVGVPGPVCERVAVAPVGRILDRPRDADRVGGVDELRREVADGVVLVDVPTPLGWHLGDAHGEAARAQARAMSHRVAGAWRGDEDEVEVPRGDGSQEAAGDGVPRDVVAVASDLRVDGAGENAARSQARGEICLVAGAREDDENRGPCARARRGGERIPHGVLDPSVSGGWAISSVDSVGGGGSRWLDGR